jgi:hypothetical protein
MRRLVLAVAFLVAGCGANVASSVRVGGPPVVAPIPDASFVIVDGGLVAGATFGISAAAANAIAVVGIVGFLFVANDWRFVPPPKLSEGRTVNLQDCTKPIVNWTANLRCASPEELRSRDEASRE